MPVEVPIIIESERIVVNEVIIRQEVIVEKEKEIHSILEIPVEIIIKENIEIGKANA